MSRTPLALRVAAAIFLIGGTLALAYVAYVAIEAKRYQAAELRRLEHPRPASPAVAAPAAKTPPAVAPVPADGRPLGEIQIARLGLSAVVVQGDSAAILRLGVGHLAETALPGHAGNVVLAGHRDTFFRPLNRVRVGDEITLKTEAGAFRYRVESTSVVRPSDVQVLRPTDQPTLTLITCYPFSYIGSAPNRFIVRAHETDAPR
jgi:sortase A